MPLRIVADCHPRFAAKTSSVDSSLARSWRGFVDEQVGRYLDCGLFENGFARIRCPECREEYLLAFSCKTRELCPSCAAKRSAATAALLAEDVLEEVGHAQWVFVIPKMLRPESGL